MCGYYMCVYICINIYYSYTNLEKKRHNEIVIVMFAAQGQYGWEGGRGEKEW
jgi:hypothetical protein